MGVTANKGPLEVAAAAAPSLPSPALNVEQHESSKHNDVSIGVAAYRGRLGAGSRCCAHFAPARLACRGKWIEAQHLDELEHRVARVGTD